MIRLYFWSYVDVRKRLLYLMSSKLSVYAMSFCPVLVDDDIDSQRKSLLLVWEKSNLVGPASFTSWRGPRL